MPPYYLIQMLIDYSFTQIASDLETSDPATS
jgi:hypothetical protein